MTNLKLIQQGAEAKIFLQKTPEGNIIIKDRISKSYRIPEIDKTIIKRRTKSETKILEKASKIISCPEPIKDVKEFNKIKMPYIEGKKLSLNLDKFPLKEQKEIMKILGKNIALLHKNHIIHGDLTTSNMILKDNKLFFIDFGLGFISQKVEDKAVDLHLLKQALEAKHFTHWEKLLEEVFKSYEKTLGSLEAKKIFERITAIERRGRYRH